MSYNSEKLVVDDRMNYNSKKLVKLKFNAVDDGMSYNSKMS